VVPENEVSPTSSDTADHHMSTHLAFVVRVLSQLLAYLRGLIDDASIVSLGLFPGSAPTYMDVTVGLGNRVLDQDSVNDIEATMRSF
jgi:hypothetical protein